MPMRQPHHVSGNTHSLFKQIAMAAYASVLARWACHFIHPAVQRRRARAVPLANPSNGRWLP
jgi:hypothetical protein